MYWFKLTSSLLAASANFACNDRGIRSKTLPLYSREGDEGAGIGLRADRCASIHAAIAS